MTRSKPPRERSAQNPRATARADLLLVERKLFDTRARAQAAIEAGAVTANGTIVSKPSAAIPRNAEITAAPAHPYVSRGGVKLAHALAQTGISVAGRICLDVGASTGGFAQALLAAGARTVIAVDVGTRQLHASLRGHSQVVSFESTDIRDVKPGQLAQMPDLAVIDVSFISLRQVIPATLALLAPQAELIALIKPQFEVGRAELKKGIVRDPAVHARVCAGIAEYVATLGLDIAAQFPSPIAGGDGNHEFFIAARRR